MDNSSSILSAQYNNLATTPGILSEIRGTGNFSTSSPLSSNWQSVSLWPETFPSYGKLWTTNNKAPVGKRVNNQWESLESKNSLKGDPYLDYGLKANNSVPTALNSLFFNKQNVNYLQKRIVDDIKQITGVTIKPQNEDALLIIMNNKYQYSLYGWLPTSPCHLALPRGQKPCSLEERLTRLNQSVLQNVIKQILSGMNMYLDYYKHASSLPTPLSLPVNVSSKGGRVLQENVGLYSGNSQGISSFNLRNSVIN